MNTIEFYNKKAEDYIERTQNLDMSDTQKRFLKYLKKRDHILDAGAGSGRDSKYFLDKGYKVTAIDGSKKLAKLASEYIGQDVLNIKFENLNFKDEFDGIWACASILHIPKSRISDILNKFFDSLKLGGVMYMSFKYGDHEVFRNERHFNYYTEKSLIQLMSKFDNLEILDEWITSDVRKDKEDEKWLNIILKKTKN